MNNKKGFSGKRVAQFRSFFSATEKAALEIMTKASWAIPPLNQISKLMDEDTEIEETTFVATHGVFVTVQDLSKMKKIKLQLTRRAERTIFCLSEEGEKRTMFSDELSRVVRALTPEVVIDNAALRVPREMNL